MFLAGVVGASVVVAAALFFTDRGDDKPEARPSPSPTTSAGTNPDLPVGVECSGADCTGQDPENMGCGGELAQTANSVTVGTTLVEVRYSKTCEAAWARITQAAPGDQVDVTALRRGEADRRGRHGHRRVHADGGREGRGRRDGVRHARRPARRAARSRARGHGTGCPSYGTAGPRKRASRNCRTRGMPGPVRGRRASTPTGARPRSAPCDGRPSPPLPDGRPSPFPARSPSGTADAALWGGPHGTRTYGIPDAR